jgi:hypothetical protein
MNRSGCLRLYDSLLTEFRCINSSSIADIARIVYFKKERLTRYRCRAQRPLRPGPISLLPLSSFGQRKAEKYRDPIVGPARSERLVWIWLLISGFNGGFGYVRCIAVKNLLHLRANAASAIAARAKGCFVRTAVTRADRSERQLL